MIVYKMLPTNVMKCTNCNIVLFHCIEDMIIEFGGPNLPHPYDQEFKDSHEWNKEYDYYSLYDTWRDKNTMWHNTLFDTILGSSEIATYNYKECQDCGHTNEYQGFVIDGEFILNVR